MPVVQLPDFEHAQAVAGAHLHAGDLAECHGAICGMLCRHPRNGGDESMRLLVNLGLVQEPDPGLRDILVTLHRAASSQIRDPQMRFQLWLPGDEEPLEVRTRSLAQWCTGFLAGLGFGHDAALDKLSEDMEGVLTDLQQIARAEVGAASDPEEEENALAEIVEYIRVATLMLREELRPAAPRESVH
jgi:uncharacterized protein YgfB (UPF0149 family)